MDEVVPRKSNNKPDNSVGILKYPDGTDEVKRVLTFGKSKSLVDITKTIKPRGEDSGIKPLYPGKKSMTELYSHRSGKESVKPPSSRYSNSPNKD